MASAGDPAVRQAGRAGLALVLLAWLAVEATLARRPDLDDHARYTAAVYMMAARNYTRFGFASDAGVPLPNGGTHEQAREARYLNWPARDFLELGVWFRAFGASVPVARAQTVFWTLLGLIGLGWGASALPWWWRRPALGPATLALSFGSIPFVVYYAHGAVPQVVAASALAVAAGARLRRLAGAGRFALGVQIAAVLVACSTTWEPLLFALAWAASDLFTRRRPPRRDGLWVFLAALALVGAEVAWLVAQGGADAWLAKASSRAHSADSLVHDVVRVLRYGRGLGYGHVLLAGVWAVSATRRFRAGVRRIEDRATLELLLAPVPWFLVFREHVAVHDVELLYFTPGLALAAWSTIGEIRVQNRGRLAVGLLAGMLVVTGGTIAAWGPRATTLEHRDDLDEPRLLGAAARESVPFDAAVATSSTELSIAWEADRYVHFGVETLEALDALLARGGVTRPRVFVISDKEEASALGRALADRYPSVRFPGARVFILG